MPRVIITYAIARLQLSYLLILRDYRLSARFSVHVVRGLWSVVSIRNSVVRGSGGSFYFVSAVIFDEGQIATRELAGRLPRADHLKREGNSERGKRVNGRWDRRGFHLNGHPHQRSLTRPLHHLVSLSSPFRHSRSFSPRTFHPLLPSSGFLPHLLPKCSNCVLSKPSINIPFDYSVVPTPKGTR